MSQPAAAIHGTDESWYLDLLGHVAHHEAITLLAAVADTYSDVPLRPDALQQHLRALAGGRAPWAPSPQVARAYLRGPLVRAGIVYPTQIQGRRLPSVRAYLPNLEGQQRRCGLYLAVLGWGLRHPHASTQLLLGQPRGGATVAGRPAQLRLALYRALLNAPGLFVPYQDLIDRIVTSNHTLHQFRQAITVLSVANILIKKRLHGWGTYGAVAIHPDRRPAIADLVTSLDAFTAETGSPARASTDLGLLLADPECVAELLGKAAASSGFVVGHDKGSTVTAGEVCAIVAASPQPMTANQVCGQLHGQGRPISRWMALEYLNHAVQAGRLRLTDAYVADDSQLPPGFGPYRFTTVDSHHEPSTPATKETHRP